MNKKQVLIRRCVNLAAWVAASIMMVSCATAPADEIVVRNMKKQENEGIVFFSVTADISKANGETYADGTGPDVRYSLSYGPTVKTSIWSGFGKAYGSIEGSTRNRETLFSRSLPPGEYSLNRLSASLPWGLQGNTDIVARFKVEPGKATYIGALRLNFLEAENKDIAKGGIKSVSLKVINDYDRAKSLFNIRNPDVTCEIKEGLMSD